MDEINGNYEDYALGLYYLERGGKLKNNNVLTRFLKKGNTQKSIDYYILASQKFELCNNINLCAFSYLYALEQCFILNKFSKIDSINVLFAFFAACNKINFDISKMSKTIIYFERYALKTLEKIRNYNKIGNIYKLIAINFKESILSIEYYKKSNKYYRLLSMLTFLIENLISMANIYLKLNNLDDAIICYKECYEICVNKEIIKVLGKQYFIRFIICSLLNEDTNIQEYINEYSLKDIYFINSNEKNLMESLIYHIITKNVNELSFIILNDENKILLGKKIIEKIEEFIILWKI